MIQNPGIESAPLAPHGNSAREHQQMRNRLGPKRCVGMSHVLDVSDVSAKSLSGHLNPQNFGELRATSQALEHLEQIEGIAKWRFFRKD